VSHAYAQSVSIGPVKADTGNDYLDAGIVLVIALILVVAIQFLRAWMVRRRWIR
jgi:hypothetical protein